MKRLSMLVAALCLLAPLLPAQEKTSDAPLSLADLAIPKNIGRIQDRYVGTSDYWVVHIQDVHGHFTAQENIAAIINHLNEIYGLSRVALEGGWSKTTFPESWGIPTSREKQSLARALMEQEYITGPAYAALLSPTPILLSGMEDRDLYEKDRLLYLKSLARRSADTEKLDQMQKKLLAKKRAVLNTRLYELDAGFNEFREAANAETFLSLLLKEASALGSDLSDLDQVVLFQGFLEKEAALDKDKLKAEAERLMGDFRGNRLSFEELLKSGGIPAEKLEHYPAARAYLDLLRLQDEISHSLFFQQLSEANTRVNELLIEKDEERAVLKEWEDFLTLKSMVLLQATNENLQHYRAEPGPVDNAAAAQGLSEALQTGLEFYELALARDQVFMRHITTDKHLAGKSLAVVAGGFHTDGFLKHLKEAGISYLVITPELGKEKPDMALYHARLKDTVVDSQTLSDIQNRFLTKRFDDAFAEGLLIRIRERNELKAVETVVRAMSSAPAPAVSDATESSPFTVDEFLAWPREKQTTWLKAALREGPKSNLALYLMIDTATLTELLKQPPAAALWEELRKDRDNVILLVYGNIADVPVEAIGGRFQVKRIQGGNLAEVTQQEHFQTRYGAEIRGGLVAGITPDGKPLPDSRIVTLQKHPVSLLYRLFLSNPQLSTLASDGRFLEAINDILLKTENLKSFLSAA